MSISNAIYNAQPGLDVPLWVEKPNMGYIMQVYQAAVNADRNTAVSKFVSNLNVFGVCKIWSYCARCIP
jgi:hypothetical protein